MLVVSTDGHGGDLSLVLTCHVCREAFRSLDTAWAELWTESRAVGDSSPGVAFTPRDWPNQTMNTLRQAWQRGQQG